MKSVVVVSLNNQLAKNCAQSLAKKLKLNFLDLSEEFDKFLLSSINAPTILVDEVLQEKETELLLKLISKPNSIIYTPNDTLLSNQNYKNLKNNFVLLILVEKLGKIKQNIQNFIKNYANLIVASNISINKIEELLKSQNV